MSKSTLEIDTPKNVEECSELIKKYIGSCYLLETGRCKSKDCPLKNKPEDLKIIIQRGRDDISNHLKSVGDINEYMKQLVRKDIPLPVYLEGDGYADGELVYDTAICQNCNAYYEVDYEHYKFCPNCGQRLDWSGVEE